MLDRQEIVEGKKKKKKTHVVVPIPEVTLGSDLTPNNLELSSLQDSADEQKLQEMLMAPFE